MKFNWKYFCGGGLAASLIFCALDYFSGNIRGAEFQLLLSTAYSAGLVYLSLKDKKDSR